MVIYGRHILAPGKALLPFRMGRDRAIQSTQISLLGLTTTYWKFYKNWLFCEVSRTFTYYVVWHRQPTSINMAHSSWEQGAQRCKSSVRGEAGQASRPWSHEVQAPSPSVLDSLFWTRKATVDFISEDFVGASYWGPVYCLCREPWLLIPLLGGVLGNVWGVLLIFLESGECFPCSKYQYVPWGEAR